jgi:hypothetical protein
MSDSGFDLLGAELPKTTSSGLSFSRSAVALGAGAVGAFVFRKHPMLAFLDAAALASNVHAVSQGERGWKDAVRRMGRHVVATAGSLAMPAFPAIGYVAGAVAADLLIDGQGGGIIEEWSRYEDVDSEVGDDRDIIDAEIVTDNTKALVKK